MSTAIETTEAHAPQPRELLAWPQLVKGLALVRHAVSKDPSRYNLTGILLEQERGVLVLTATDGHRLEQARVPLPEHAGWADPKATFLLEGEDADRLVAEGKRWGKKAGKRGGAYRVRLAIGPAWASWVDTFGPAGGPLEESLEDRIECKPIEGGEFPNYRQVIGQHKPAAAFNGRYLAEAAKALGEVNERSHALELCVPEGEEASVSPWRLETVDADGFEAFAIVMPMRL